MNRLTAIIVCLIALCCYMAWHADFANVIEPESPSSLVAIAGPPGDSPAIGIASTGLLRVTERIFVGGQPTSATFSTLAEQGVRTVLSVDGATPQLKLAAEHGIEYIHVPIGYDGVSEHEAGMLANVARSVSTPLYVHCHHGRHRGPVAAVIVAMAANDLDHAQAVHVLEEAGTGDQYAGLWQAVRSYEPPPADARLPSLVSQASVDTLATCMVSIDLAFERLMLCRDANRQTPTEHPDIELSHELLMLNEAFQESVRFAEKSRQQIAQQETQSAESTLLHELKQSESLSVELQRASKQRDWNALSEGLDRLKTSCQQCHEVHRN